MSAVNEYSCGIEKTQNGKYNVRVRAAFASPAAAPWTLRLYFLASSFNAAMKKLEEALQLLQKNEEKLRFWAVERTDDPNFAGDLLREFGLWLDRRHDFPRKIAELSILVERQVPASQLAQVRRTLKTRLDRNASYIRPLRVISRPLFYLPRTTISPCEAITSLIKSRYL